MDRLWLAFGWFMVVVGVGAIVVGVATLTRHEVLPPWLRGFVKWRRWGWTQVTMGLFCLFFVVPDLAGAPDTLTTILRVVALGVMFVGLGLDRGADLPRVRSDA